MWCSKDISVVQVEMGELSLRYRQVLMQYWANLQGSKGESIQRSEPRSLVGRVGKQRCSEVDRTREEV